MDTHKAFIIISCLPSKVKIKLAFAHSRIHSKPFSCPKIDILWRWQQFPLIIANTQSLVQICTTLRMNNFAYNVYVDSENVCLVCMAHTFVYLVMFSQTCVVQWHLVDIASNDYCNIFISVALFDSGWLVGWSKILKQTEPFITDHCIQCWKTEKGKKS